MELITLHHKIRKATFSRDGLNYIMMDIYKKWRSATLIESLSSLPFPVGSFHRPRDWDAFLWFDLIFLRWVSLRWIFFLSHNVQRESKYKEYYHACNRCVQWKWLSDNSMGNENTAGSKIIYDMEWRTI